MHRKQAETLNHSAVFREYSRGLHAAADDLGSFGSLIWMSSFFATILENNRFVSHSAYDRCEATGPSGHSLFQCQLLVHIRRQFHT